MFDTYNAPMKNKDANVILSENLKKLLADDDTINTRPALSKRTGGFVSERTLTVLLNPATTGSNPTLETVSAVASAFGLEPWQLIHPSMGKAVVAADDIDAAMRLIRALQGNKKPAEAG